MMAKLTDDAVSRLPLAAGRAELLEEIMSTVAPDRPTDRPRTDPAPRAWLVPWPWPPRSSPASPRLALVGWWPTRRSRVRRSRCPGGLGSPARATAGARRPGLDGRYSLAAYGDVRSSSVSGTDGATSRSRRTPPRPLRLLRRGPRHIVDPPAPGPADRGPRRPARCGPTARTTTPRSARSRTATGSSSAARHGRGGLSRAAGPAPADLGGGVRRVPPRRLVTEASGRAGRAIIDDIEGVSGAGLPAGTSLDLGRASKDRYQFGVEVAGPTPAPGSRRSRTRGRQRPGPADEAARVLGTSRSGRSCRRWTRRRLPRGGLGATPTTVVAGEVPEGYREGLGCPGSRQLSWGLGAQLLDPVEQLRLLLFGERHRELVQVVAQLGDLDLAVLGRLSGPPHRDGPVGERRGRRRRAWSASACAGSGWPGRCSCSGGRRPGRRLHLQLVVGVHQLPLLVAPPAQLPGTHDTGADLSQPVGPAPESSVAPSTSGSGRSRLIPKPGSASSRSPRGRPPRRSASGRWPPADRPGPGAG